MRTTSPLLICAVLASCGDGASPAGSSLERADARAESLVLFVVDTLRADALTPYGAAPGSSPAIDAFAEDALVFEAAYTQATHTNAAMASMLTGLYPHENGVLGQSENLADGIDSIAPGLVERGFATGAFISGHCMMQEKRRLWSEGWTTRGCVRDDTDEQYRWDDEVLEDALDWIDAQDGPFVAWIFLLDPHDEHLPAPELWDYAARPQPDGAEQRRRYHEYERANNPIPDDVRAELLDLYAAEVRGVDAAFARLLAAVEDRDDVAVVLTADHGEELFETSPRAAHGRVLTEGVLHVPLILRAPGLPPGREPGLVETLQLAPTILQLLDAPARFPFSRPSLLASDATRGIAISNWGDALTLRTPDMRVWRKVERMRRDPMSINYDRFDANSPVPWLAPRAAARVEADGGLAYLDAGELAGDEAALALEERLEQHALGLRAVRGNGELDAELRAELEDLGYL